MNSMLCTYGGSAVRSAKLEISSSIEFESVIIYAWLKDEMKIRNKKKQTLEQFVISLL